MAYLGGPVFRRRQQLRLAKPPRGGFAPTPRKLRNQKPSRQLRDKQRRAARREARELRIFARILLPLLVLLAAATVILFIVAVATRH